MRAWAILSVILLAILAADVIATSTATKTFQYPLRVYHGGRYMNGDSGDVVVAYPSDDDTTGERNALTWVGGSFSAWRFEPDSSEVWDFYANDTLLTLMSGKYYQGPTLYEGSISDSRTFAAGVVDSAALGTDAALKSLKASASSLSLDLSGPDSLIRIIKADTLQGNYVRAMAVLHVPVTLTASDGDLAVTGTSSADSLRSRALRTTSDSWIGDGIGDDHTITGTLTQTGGTVVVGGNTTFNGTTLFNAVPTVAADSMIVGSGGDTTTVAISVANGFIRFVDSIEVEVPALGTSAIVAFPGATADMVFVALPIDSGGSTMVLNMLAAKYDSPGHIEWLANSHSGGARTYRVIGFKF